MHENYTMVLDQIYDDTKLEHNMNSHDWIWTTQWWVKAKVTLVQENIVGMIQECLQFLVEEGYTLILFVSFVKVLELQSENDYFVIEFCLRDDLT
jgi:hypothetical protein